MAGRRCAEWRFPTEKQDRAETTARRMARVAQARLAVDEAPLLPVGPSDNTPDADWASILSDPRATTGARRKLHPSQALRDISAHVLRTECLKCFRIVEIQTADALRLYGGHSTWRDVGKALLEDGCQNRTCNRDPDGCWPDYQA